ncbi:MAG: O-antigen polysaccharide polymerase Wzy [Actinomycetaceae bacterium]|nr:O-antigen polysaccharide polymerase Wzy [Actinomycetaceae bacterium]
MVNSKITAKPVQLALKIKQFRDISVERNPRGTDFFTGLFIVLIGLMFFTGVALYGYFRVEQNWEGTFAGIWTIWGSMVLYSIIRYRQQLVTLFFLIVFFVFLLGRPLVRLVKGTAWWIGGVPGVEFSSKLLFLGLVFLASGALIAELLSVNEWSSRSRRYGSEKNEPFVVRMEKLRDTDPRIRSFAQVAFVVFVVAALAAFYLSLEKYSFMQGKTYTDYYLYFDSTAPLPVRTLATFYEYAMAAYLITMPRKRAAYAVLIVNIAIYLPLLVIGLRGSFVLAGIFAVFYVVYRHRYPGKDKWLGKAEKSGLLFGLPVLAILLNMINYLRSQQVSSLSLGGQLVDFVDKQGVSFDVLARGYYASHKLEPYDRSFVFGPFIEFFTHTSYGKLLFPQPASTGESFHQTALERHGSANALSFFEHPNYFGGEGYGSSYLLELYFDYRWVGVVIGSLLLGVLLAVLPKLIDRGGIIGIIGLVSVLYILWIPRGNALDWVMFVFTIQFWACVATIFIIASSYRRSRPYIATAVSADKNKNS